MIGLLLLTTLSPAEEVDEIDVTQEIIVWGDRFARWDDTRWYIESDIVQPWTLRLQQDLNKEFDTQEYRISAVFACAKQYALNRRRYEVACSIEDVGLIANIADPRITEERIAIAQDVLYEIDGKLTGAQMQLRVGDDGRVLGIEIEGIPTRNRRQNRIEQTLTQLMARLIVGFDLKLQKDNQLHEKVWIENNTRLLFLATQATGSNYVKHYLNRYQRQLVVQSIGRGISSTDDPSLPRFDVHLDGVSLFNPEDGYLIERVWSIEGTSDPTGTFVTLQYYHNGVMRELGDRDRPDCGPSQVVNGRRQNNPRLPNWPAKDSL